MRFVLIYRSGLINYPFLSMEEITDVEAKGKYAELLEEGMTPERAFQIIVAGTREHTRILLPWNKFAEGTRKELIQKIRPEVTRFYKKMIALRKQEPALVYGDFTVLNKQKDRFVYKRSYEGTEFIIDCNLGDKFRQAWNAKGYELVMPIKTKNVRLLQPYAIRIYKKKK